MISNKIFPKYNLPLVFFLFFHVINNFIWARRDISPPEWDQSLHLFHSFRYFKVLENWTNHLYYDLLDVESYYPPFYHLSMQPFLFFLGFSEDTLVIGNGFYMGLLPIVTYLIAKEISDSQTALLSGFLISTFPFLLHISRNGLIDTALAFITTVSIYFLMKSRNFASRRYSVLFGLAVGLAMLTKWTFLFFLIGPFTWCFLVAMRDSESSEESFRKFTHSAIYFILLVVVFLLPVLFILLTKGKYVIVLLELFLIYLLRKIPRNRRMDNAFGGIAISFLICAPWYFFNVIGLIKGSKFAGAGTGEGDPTEIGQMFLYYIENLHVQIGLPWAILFGIGLLFLVVVSITQRDKRSKSEYIILLAWLIVPYIIFSLINNKDLRYTLPYLPAIAIIAAAPMGRISSKSFLNIMYPVLILFGMYQFIGASYGLPFRGDHVFFKEFPPVNENWPHREILKDIKAEISDGKIYAAKILANHPYFNRGNFRNMAQIDNLDLDVNLMKKKKYMGTLTDYIITKTGYLGPGSMESKRIRDLIPKEKTLNSVFKVFKTYALPDGSQAIVYKIDPEPIREIPPEELISTVKNILREGFQNYPKYGLSNAQNFNLEIIPHDIPEETLKGNFKSIKISAGSGFIDKKFKISNLESELSSIRLNLHELLDRGKIIIFGVEKISPRGTVSASDIEDALLQEIGELKDIKIRLEDNWIDITCHLNVPPLPNWKIHILGQVILKEGAIRTHIKDAEIGYIRIPNILFRKYSERIFPINPSPAWPMFTEIHAISINNGIIDIR